MDKESELHKFFENISPAELAKLRQKRQDTSTRDKAALLKKVSEIEDILQKLDVKIILENKTT